MQGSNGRDPGRETPPHNPSLSPQEVYTSGARPGGASPPPDRERSEGVTAPAIRRRTTGQQVRKAPVEAFGRALRRAIDEGFVDPLRALTRDDRNSGPGKLSRFSLPSDKYASRDTLRRAKITGSPAVFFAGLAEGSIGRRLAQSRLIDKCRGGPGSSPRCSPRPAASRTCAMTPPLSGSRRRGTRKAGPPRLPL